MSTKRSKHKPAKRSQRELLDAISTRYEQLAEKLEEVESRLEAIPALRGNSELHPRKPR